MTVVENYFNQELSDIVFEVDKLEEWKDMAEQLGMDNQLKLTKGKDSPVPFPYMNTTMIRVFEELCPRQVSYKEYDKTPIPLEIMKLIAFSIKEKHFNEIQIWYDDKSPDPVVVGLTYQWYNNAKLDGKYIYFDSREECIAHPDNNGTAFKTNVNNYLIAKWGDAKRSFDELKKMAIRRFIDINSNQMQKDIKILQDKLNVIKENANCYFAGNISKDKATTTNDW